MKKAVIFLTVAAVMLSVFSFAARAADAAKPKPAYLDPSKPIDDRVKDLISRMTLMDKTLLLNNDAGAIPRLGIKEYHYWNEALHGIAFPGKFTVFPQAVAMASSWDPDMIFKVSTAISDEAWGAINRDAVKDGYPGRRFLTFWSPTINMARDPRWGRTPETYGEDPFLTGRLALSFVRGIQGNDPKYLKAVSTPKHFAANNVEKNRVKYNAVISEKSLREYYFPAFKTCVVEGGAMSVMGAYNAVNGIPCNANKWLLTDVLRNEWGFKGFVVTDCGAAEHMYKQHKYVATAPEAAAAALKAGVDVECGAEVMRMYSIEAIKKKLITEADIDTALTHILKVRMQLGMFDPPEMIPFTKIPPSVIGSKEHQELARQVSRESMVLLKNDKVGGVPLLPLNEKKLKKIAVVGPIAAILQFGDYSGTPVNEPVTILDGLKKRLGGRVEISNFEWRPAPEYTRFMPVPIPGIKAEYFTNGDMSGKPVAVRTEDSVNITPAGAPDQVRTGEAISARWKGVLKPDATGMYNLYIIARGEASLLVNGKEVFRTQPVVKKKPKMKTGVALDDEVYKAMTEKRRSAVVAFEAGKSYDIEVRYKLAKGEPMIRLEWVKPPAAPEAAREVEAIKSADVVIAVMGLKRDDEAEGMDRETLDLPNDQTEYLKQLVSLNKNVVAVLVHGSPLSINWMKEGMPAILEAWYPGEQGGNAVADVLFGDYNPAGRLTTTSFKSVDDLPSFDDHEVYNGRTYMYFKGEPLFPFGYGLSYSEFEYSGLKLDRASAAPGDVVNVVLNVKNKGPRDGDEVVQVYVRDLAPGENKPNKRLCGFKRVGIKNGATARVEIPVKISDLGYWNVERHRFEVEPGKYEIQVGASSADIRQTATMDVAGGPAK